MKKISEEEAVEKLVEFIKETADLDDLAKMYSQVISDETVVVEGDSANSDPFAWGDRVPTGSKQ